MEYGDIGPKVAAFAVNDMLSHAQSALRLDLFGKGQQVPPSHLEVRCSVCEAERGERCRPVRRHFNWIGDKHAERVDDARVVAEALRALTPEETVTFRSGDTVNFASKRFTIP